MKRVTYKFKYIRSKFKKYIKQNIPEHFKSKQQKSFILILQSFSNPSPLQFYKNYVTPFYYPNC